MLVIDGSQGEGGGQILRTALSLSLVTGRPFRLTHIRAGRKKPGLLAQHLTAVRAATEVGRADVQGAELGATELSFVPGQVTPGEYRFAIGTAGSATLVFQTVLPALLHARAPSRLILTGGTHNDHAPPFDFLAKTFVPVLNRLGAQVEVRLIRPGFYPVGGGEFEATIVPAQRWERMELIERGALRSRQARALVARLPAHIGDRELAQVERALGWTRDEVHVEEVADARGPGNVLILELEYEKVTEVVTGFGARGVPAETVAQNAIAQARAYLASDAPVGAHLADQLLLPLVLGAGGVFRAVDWSLHAQTNATVIRQFLDVRIESQQEPGGTWHVVVASAQ